MIDRIVRQGLNHQQESFYFQLIPISLTLVNTQCDLPAPGTTYKFSVFKGTQKFDENRIPIEAEFTKVNSFNVLAINSCRLNFYLPSVPKGRKIEFALRAVQRENNTDYPLGDYSIDANALVSSFKDDNVSRHELKSMFSEDYELEFEIYVDNNRVALEKNIRDHRQDRAIKSPLRTRKEEESSPSGRKNFTEEKKVQPESRKEGSTIKKETTREPEPEEATQPVSEDRGYEAEQRPNTAYEAPRERQAETGSVASKQSKGAVPLVQTKFRPVSKADTPAEIMKKESQRLGTTVLETSSVVSKEGGSNSDTLFTSLFLLAGMLIIYWAMIPSSKV